MSSCYVTVYYGPCDSVHGIVIHKPQKVRGLRDRLQKLGFRVDLVPVEFINYCKLEMCGFEVFRCNLRNLGFNRPCNEDPVCQRAVAAVVESFTKFESARNYLIFWKQVDRELFRRSKYAPKDYWPVKEKPKELVTSTKEHPDTTNKGFMRN